MTLHLVVESSSMKGALPSNDRATAGGGGDDRDSAGFAP